MEPRTDRSPFATRSGRGVHGNDQAAAGFGAGPAPGATLTDGSRTTVSVIGAAGFAAAFPADFPALRFSTAFPSGGLRVF